MHILITGGSGFLGARLARALLAQGSLALAGAAAAPIDRITLADRNPPPASLAGDARVTFLQGDLNDQLGAGLLPATDIALVYHLAAAVSAECEADFDRGMRSNLAGTQTLLEACRGLGTQPVFVFSSSLAVFGATPQLPFPEVVEDSTLPTPQSSYGIQKFIGEQLVADYTRKGYVRGRSARLMTVSVRPGKPNGAASGFLSGMIREPLAGIRARVPVTADTTVALASPGRTIAGLIRVAEASAEEWGPYTAINLPSFKTTVGEMAAALERVGGPAAAALLDWDPDPAVSRLIKSWPDNIAWERARGLGLVADADFESVLRDYVRENPSAVKNG